MTFFKELKRIRRATRRWLKAAPRSKVIDTVRMLMPRKFDGTLIRLGPEADGGYLVPDDLDGITGSISPGVSYECGFDLALAERGVKIVMADASVSGPPLDHPNFTFVPKFVGPADTGSVTTLDALAALLPSGDLLLQMDIEGAEYGVIESLSDEILRRFRIMVIEFHDLRRQLDRRHIGRFRSIIGALSRNHFVAHAHANNVTKLEYASGVLVPPILELTFYRKDRTSAVRDEVAPLPHPLDRDNVAVLPPVPADWVLA